MILTPQMVNNEFLLINKKHTDVLIEQTKTKTQETTELNLNKQMVNFYLLPAINVAGEGKWLLAVTSFEATNSVFNLTNEHISLSVITPERWIPEGSEEI